MVRIKEVSMRGRPAELLTALAGAFMILLAEFEVHNFTDGQFAAVIGFVALLPAAVTAFVEMTK